MNSERLHLPDVTLLAISSVNVDATVKALSACIERIDFAAAKLVSHKKPDGLAPQIEFVAIPRLASSRDYSRFMLANLAPLFDTSHCLIVQWDGYALRPELWRNEFLDYDYIGASWPQFGDQHVVGNGGFSLRSLKLAEACRSGKFRQSHPEDLAIGRQNRAWLESIGCRFAPRPLADRFSAERAGDPENTFGFHGVWHMPRALGNDRFFDIYRSLDERGSLAHDFWLILWQVLRGQAGARRTAKLLADRFSGVVPPKARAGKAAN